MATYSYSTHIVRQNAEANQALLGVKLGRQCIALGIPVMQVAHEFGVSRNTIYSWFCGTHDIRENRIEPVEKYIARIAKNQ